jgi:TonB family protein
MTDATRFRAALCISLFLHFMLLQAQWASDPARAGKGERLSQEIGSSAPLFSEILTIGIESFTENAYSDGEADKRQKERIAYLNAVSEAIHARRFVSAAADRSLIGLASFSFTIMSDGSFRGIALASSSGNRDLDKAAEAAVRSANGIVKRPPALGQEAIDLITVVKYQYEW